MTNANQFIDIQTHAESEEEHSKRPEPANQEVSPDKEEKTNVYLTRWYILVIMSLAVLLQNICWGTWGPIAQSAKAVYGWSTGLLAVMINCCNAGVLTCLVPAGYIVNKQGLRVSLLLTTFFLTVSPALRSVTFQPITADVLIGVGQYCAGIAGAFTQVTVALVSETWFPSNERTTATTIAALSSAVGGGAAFLLGPGLVSQPEYNDISGNDSDHTNKTTALINKSTMESEIRKLSLIELGFGAALFLLTIVYFPKKPPRPPSISASVKRQNFKDGVAQLTRNVDFWRVNILCGISFAIFLNWLGLLNVNLNHLGVTQAQAGWFGFYAFAAGSVGGTVIGRIVDQFQRRLKLFQIVLLGLSTAIATWITCMRNEYTAHTHVLLAVSIALLSVLVYTSFPLNMEFACEIGYPVSEEIVSMCLGLGLSASAVVFLLLQLIPGIGVTWMNWALVGLLGLPVLFLFTFRGRYHRSDVDAMA